MQFDDVLKTVPKSSWLHDWMGCWPSTESPRSFVCFAGLTALGACIGRGVWLKDDFFTMFPMLNILCIGPSGVGKTTALEYMAMPMIRRMPAEVRPQLIEGKISPQKLAEDLLPNPHAILYAEELATLFTKEKFQEAMIPTVTKLLNYLDVHEERTKSGGIITVPKPSVIVVGGSTPEWLQEQLPDSATSGGFLARFLICYEQHKAQRIPLARYTMSKTRWQDLMDFRQRIEEQFHTLTHLTGEMAFEDFAAVDEFSEWYINLKPIAGNLAPFAARGREFVQRLAMLVALTCSRMFITEEDIKAGIALWTYCTLKLTDVVSQQSGKGKLLSNILKVVGTQEVTETLICRMMRNYETSQEVLKLIQSLIMSGELVRTPEGKIRRN